MRLTSRSCPASPPAGQGMPSHRRLGKMGARVRKSLSRGSLTSEVADSAFLAYRPNTGATRGRCRSGAAVTEQVAGRGDRAKLLRHGASMPTLRALAVRLAKLGCDEARGLVEDIERRGRSPRSRRVPGRPRRAYRSPRAVADSISVAAAADAGSQGMVITASRPPSGRLRAAISPPCSSAMRRAIGRPRPVPVSWVEK